MMLFYLPVESTQVKNKTQKFETVRMLQSLFNFLFDLIDANTM